MHERNSAEKIKLERTPSENLFEFYFYFMIKDALLQDTKNLKSLTNIQDINIDSTEKFCSLTFFEGDKKRTWEEIQDFFEDGYEKHNLKTFKSNLVKCLLLIKKINISVMENKIPYSPIRLKVLYRELYLEKPKYGDGRKTGMTIVNEFLKNNEMQSSEDYFIREILNKGFFVEYGLIKEFYAKNKLQENLYYLACLCLSKLKPLLVVSEFKNVVNFMRSEICELENEHRNHAPIPEGIYKDIGDFDFPLNFEKMTKEETEKIIQLLEKLLCISE